MRTSLTSSDYEFLKALKIAPSMRDVSVTPAGVATSAASPAPFYTEDRDALWNMFLDALAQRNGARESAKRWRRQALWSWGLFMAAVSVIVWFGILPAKLRALGWWTK